jgi:hypothetical protein
VERLHGVRQHQFSCLRQTARINLRTFLITILSTGVLHNIPVQRRLDEFVEFDVVNAHEDPDVHITNVPAGI